MKTVIGWIVAIVLAAVTGLVVLSTLKPDLWKSVAVPESTSKPHAHDHGEHASADSIVLSAQARLNLGLKVAPIKLQSYWQSIPIPGTIVERPGHSHRKISSPMTGIISDLFVHPNQLIKPGEPIAQLELKGDALATTQGELLRIVRELELNDKELKRITSLVDMGSVPERNKLTLEYEHGRLQAQLESKLQQLEVLGLSASQIDTIRTTGKLLRTFTIHAPPISSEERAHMAEAAELMKGESKDDAEQAAVGLKDPGFTVESIDVFPGKQVAAGDEIGSLAFHVVLYVEGQAFEREGEAVAQAMRERWPVAARFETGSNEQIIREQLVILFMDNIVDQQTRTFKFYLPLPNEVLLDSYGPQKEIYRSWRFKPGQKAELQVPVAKLSDVIVLPAEAVVREGPQAFAFVENGDKFERRGVHVQHIGRGEVVLANDGSVFPGEIVATNNAYQINLAVKKVSGEGGGGGHEGHDHGHAGHSHEH
ncbi:efflux RND transporter periplasmic adaptor subunit [bacterium]|nr:efflux RND transporter periplasmic adaptor subunit [bacterium]